MRGLESDLAKDLRLADGCVCTLQIDPCTAEQWHQFMVNLHQLISFAEVIGISWQALLLFTVCLEKN